MVTITDARVTPDLREATLYYTVYGRRGARTSSAARAGERQGRAAQDGRPADRGPLHPVAAFVADVVPEKAGRIDELLAEARAADALVHAIAEGATYAGEADPYRAPRPGAGE